VQKQAKISIAIISLLLLSKKFSMSHSTYNYFTLSEFDSPDAPGSGAKMSPAFVQKLDAIRKEVGSPLTITSGYRTPAYNSTLKNSVPNSAHTKGLAADIAAPTTTLKVKIAKAAIKQGINRIGWGNSYIHLDIDRSKPQNAAWGYNGNPPLYTISQLKNMI